MLEKPFHQVTEQKANNQCRDCGDEDVESQISLWRGMLESQQRFCNSKQFLPVKRQQTLRNQQVSGRGNGDELGQALDNAEEKRLEESHKCVSFSFLENILFRFATYWKIKSKTITRR